MQVAAALQLAVGDNPGPVEGAQLGRLRVLASLKLKFSQMEALTPILEAGQFFDSETVGGIAAALSDEDVTRVLAMPVFRDFTSVLKATAQPQAKKLAVATLLVLLRSTAMTPQAREELRATLTALVTPDTPWSTLNGRFYRQWDDLSGAVSAAVGGEEHLAEFKYANVAAFAMLALLMSEGLVLGSAADALEEQVCMRAYVLRLSCSGASGASRSGAVIITGSTWLSQSTSNVLDETASIC